MEKEYFRGAIPFIQFSPPPQKKIQKFFRPKIFLYLNLAMAMIQKELSIMSNIFNERKTELSGEKCFHNKLTSLTSLPVLSAKITQ